MRFQLLSSVTFLLIQRSFASYVEPAGSAYAGATLPLIPSSPPPPLYRRPLLKHRYISSLSPAVTYTDEVQVVKPTPYVTAPEMTFITPVPQAYITYPRRSYYSPAYKSYFGYLPSYVAPTTIPGPYGTYRTAYLSGTGVRSHLRPPYHPRITVRNLARSYARGTTTPDIPVHIAVAPASGPIAVAAAFANQHHFSDCEWPCPYYYLSNHHHPRAAMRNYLKTFTKESGLTSDTSLYIEKEHSPHVHGIRPLPHIVGPVPLLYTSDVMHRKAAEKKARRLLLKRRAFDTEQLRQNSKTEADSHNNL